MTPLKRLDEVGTARSAGRSAGRLAGRSAGRLAGRPERANNFPRTQSVAKPSTIKPRPLAARPNSQAQATVAAPVGNNAALWTELQNVRAELADVRARKLSITPSERRLDHTMQESDRTAGARPRVLFASDSVADPVANLDNAAPYAPSTDAHSTEPDTGTPMDPSMGGTCPASSHLPETARPRVLFASDSVADPVANLDNAAPYAPSTDAHSTEPDTGTPMDPSMGGTCPASSHLPETSLRAEILAVEGQKVALLAQLEDCQERLVKLQGQLSDILSCNVNNKAAMRIFDEHYGTGSSILTFARIHRPPGTSASPVASAEVKVNGNTIEIDEAPDGSRRAKSFSVDLALPPNTSQAEVFTSLSPLVQKVAEGKKVCFFAFGQTGSGKTYTMIGPMTKKGNSGENIPLRKDEIGKGDHRGFMPRAAELIFSAVEQASLRSEGDSLVFELQAVEIAGKDCRDVFDPKSAKKLIIQNSGEVSGLMSMPVTSVAQVTTLMAEVQKKRATAGTLQNATSSRSHVLLRLKVLHENSNKLFGQLDVFDLAGGENINKSGVEGNGKKEAVNINNSLRSLEMSLNMMRNGTVEGIAFRENPLTQLLRAPMCGTHS